MPFLRGKVLLKGDEIPYKVDGRISRVGLKMSLAVRSEDRRTKWRTRFGNTARRVAYRLKEVEACAPMYKILIEMRKRKITLESIHWLGVIENLSIVRYIHKCNEEQVKLTDVVVLYFMPD